MSHPTKRVSRVALLVRRAELAEEQARIDRALAVCFADDESDASYTSESLPRGTSRRVFRELCRSGVVIGAVMEGRVWRCTREAWFAARRSTPVPPVRVAAPPAELDEAEAAARDLADAGLRATRRSA